MACSCLLWALASSAAEPHAVHFDIPASSLDQALLRFTEQTGFSVGMTGSLPAVRTRAVVGDLSPQGALQRMLAGTGLHAVPSGGAAFRLEADSAGTPADGAQELQAPQELAEVIVTASKREQDWRTVPMSMSVITSDELQGGVIPGGSQAALLRDAATSSTHLGPGRERQFIRGVADSAFLGPSQATVSVQFDDARATYDAPDPDLMLLDIAQVEILKGPQGPLYGTGALGGVFHIVPRRPDLHEYSWQTSAQLTQVQAGGFGGGADLVLNAPLVQDKWGLRGVAYFVNSPGWIENTDGLENANDTRTYGGRLALRGSLPSDWTLDVQALGQSAKTSDSQYVTDVRHSLRRSGIQPEPHENDFYLASVTAQGRWWGKHALLTTSFVGHGADGVLDASPAASLWGETAPLLYDDERTYRLMNQEVRFWSDPGARWGWLLGASYLAARSDLTGTLSSSGAERQVLSRNQRVSEPAIFGEISKALYTAWRVTAGLRLFRSQISNEGRTALLSDGDDHAFYTATPSFSIDWRNPDERRFVYLRYARAVRPGGVNLDSTELRRFDADELSNIDLGTRLLLRDDALSVDSALFATHWSHIQSDYLLTNGLVGTRNAGAGRIFGLESSMRWVLDDAWRLESSFTVQHVRLHHPVVSVDDDPRLPVVPDVRVRGSVARSLQWGSWQVELRANANYIGPSRLSFEQVLDRKAGGYVLADLGAQFKRDALTWSLTMSNVLDSRADTFAYGNPFSVHTAQQYTPLAPRTLMLGLTYKPAH